LLKIVWFLVGNFPYKYSSLNPYNYVGVVEEKSFLDVFIKGYVALMLSLAKSNGNCKRNVEKRVQIWKNEKVA